MGPCATLRPAPASPPPNPKPTEQNLPPNLCAQPCVVSLVGLHLSTVFLPHLPGHPCPPQAQLRPTRSSQRAVEPLGDPGSRNRPFTVACVRRREVSIEVDELVPGPPVCGGFCGYRVPAHPLTVLAFPQLCALVY